jgi:hypothetical protein
MAEDTSTTEPSSPEQPEKQQELLGFIDIENEAYHKSDGLSSTGIKKLLRSPAHYKSFLEEQNKILCVPDAEPSRALTIGSAFHTLVLEPHLFEKQYIVAPDKLDKRTISGKMAHINLLMSNKIVLEKHEHEMLVNMKEAIKSNRMASFLIFGGEQIYEKAGYWEDPIFNCLCKCKPDIRLDRPKIIVDLKTTNDASKDEFNNSIYKYGYFISAAHYLNGMKALTHEEWDKFVIVAVEKTPPYGVATYAISEEWLYLGRAQCRKAYEKYAECLLYNQWPGYVDRAENVYPPAWVTKKIVPEI